MSPRPRSAPRWLERIVERCVPQGLWGEGVLGDLAEEFERRARRSAASARIWYAGQTLSILWNCTIPRRGDSVMGRSQLAMDLRWSLRAMLRNPAFTVAVIAILGLGLAANTGVFSVVSGTFRNTSWWRDADATVAVWPGREFSQGELGIYAGTQSVYRTLGAYTEQAFSLAIGTGEPTSVTGVVISPDLFAELAEQPVLGRAFVADDAIPGAEPVVVLSRTVWRRAFGEDPGVLGSDVAVNGIRATVIGIQAGSGPGGRAEMWLPLVIDQRSDDYWPLRNLNVVGVLRDDATLAQAFDDLVAHTDNLSNMFPAFYPPGFAAGRTSVAGAEASQRAMISTPLLLLLGGTTLLMLITALNVGNLLLGRAIQRRAELAVRTALGASRSRIVVQLLVESAVWTALALVLGVTGASFAGQWIAGLFVGEVVVVSSPVTAGPMLIFISGLAVLTVLILSGIPILHYLRSQRAGLTVRPAPAARTQRWLVTAQAALATVLLVSAVLLVATVDNLRSVPLGFDAGGVTAVELSPPENRIATRAQVRGLYDGLIERVESIPGVEAAGLTGTLPLQDDALAYPVNLQTAQVDPGQAIRVPKHSVDPGFFAVLQVTPMEGRLLGSEDRAPRPSAVVVNATMAERFWPDVSPVGQMIAIDPHAWTRWVEVVGVIPDIRSGEITGPPEPAMYVALAESPTRNVTVLVRSTSPAAVLVPAVRRAVVDVDPLVPIRAITRMDDVVRAAYSTSWVVMGLLIVLAALATGFGAVGIYAVLAHHVTLSRKDIGVRMALGADPAMVVRSVVRSGMVLAGLGILLGSIGALWSSRLLESLLFGVSALWPLAFVAPALGLLAAAGLAALIPAARAGRLPPSEVLRSE